MESNRKYDMAVEREIAAFLNEHLYSNKEIFTEFARTDTYDEQMRGSDLILSLSDKKIDRVIVDEKVAARYANTNLDSFALELSFISKIGTKVCGWFLDSSKSTQYYLFGWILKADIEYNKEKRRYNTDSITRDNIKEFEWCLVSRQKIADFLESKGWTLDMLARQDEAIRERGCVKTSEFVNGISFRYSEKYAERPINVLLKKQIYIDLSECHGIVTANEGKISTNIKAQKEKCLKDGKSDEELVMELLSSQMGGSVKRASRDEDYKDHIDFWWNTLDGNKFGIDVKGLNKVWRFDDGYDDTIHWVRLVDKQGREDRFYVKADYIAFRAMKKVIFVKWKKLVEFVLEMVKGKEVVTKNPRKCYIPYNRDRDIAVMVLNDDLEKLSDFVLHYEGAD